jgi:peptidoglycan/xylan/chitin deacetylase (PgdA/CDA1 family)
VNRYAHVIAQAGIPRFLDMAWGEKRLTVLTYHRVNDADAPDFPYARYNVSASPEDFARQMDYVAGHFNVIGLEALRAFVQDGTPLPPRPVLITFDDGYRDNYVHAYPVLRARGMPAVIFLYTSRMDDPTPPWWDECAHHIERTSLVHAALPLVGPQDLSTPDHRNLAHDRFVERFKGLPESEKPKALNAFRAALQVDPLPPDRDLFLTWNEVRELVAGGIACQPHTVSHPILTRLNPDQLQRELADSRAQVEQQTGQPAYAFAYPNGLQGDYDAHTMAVLRENGYALAFTLLDGPMRADAVRRNPLEIRRIHITHRDSFERFILKVMGMRRLVRLVARR